MVDVKNLMSRSVTLWVGGAALLAAGVVGGAGAIGLTRPGIEVAPIRPVAIASLAQRDGGLVTVRGKVAEVYGDRFTIADGSGKTMVDAARDDDDAVTAGQDLLVQGRYDNGQLHASFLVDANGRVRAVGPFFARGPHRGRLEGRHGPGGAEPGRGGPPSAACDTPPPPAPQSPAPVVSKQ